MTAREIPTLSRKERETRVGTLKDECDGEDGPVPCRQFVVDLDDLLAHRLALREQIQVIRASGLRIGS